MFLEVGSPEWEAWSRRKPVPQIPCCTSTVSVPTLSVRDAYEGHQRVMVQWNATASRGSLDGLQFDFHILSPTTDDLRWFGKPEIFRVVFLGPLRDLPDKSKGN